MDAEEARSRGSGASAEQGSPIPRALRAGRLPTGRLPARLPQRLLLWLRAGAAARTARARWWVAFMQDPPVLDQPPLDRPDRLGVPDESAAELLAWSVAAAATEAVAEGISEGGPFMVPALTGREEIP
mmetsp:Transcript_56466/g.103616  ORF Transcript_56466/g.103616 Transcript_56466/m.103616 type:complete len:128 (+) Transcript_56466:258-641(+)